MTDKRLVLSTASSLEEARLIARTLVERQLAACVNIVGPIESIYRWKGAVENAQEYLLLIKTTAALFARLRDEFKQLHSYEFPECIELTIEDGLPAYLEWIGESVRG
jgi:periplasmic divalent cation tolerance protein